MSSGHSASLAELARGLPGVSFAGDPGVIITGISYDSREVKPGHLFAAVPGTRTHGNRFIPGAIEAGAAAVLADSAAPDLPVPVVQAPDVRMAMGALAARMYGHPDHKLFVIGITGTNGKTTTSYLIESILNQAGMRTGVVGTVNYRFESLQKPAGATTPESADLVHTLACMQAAGATHAVVEISSHALHQKRVSGVCIRHALFTNLSREHLDYHADMEDYFQAKRGLFTEVIQGRWNPDPPANRTSPVAVINLDDPYGRRLHQELESRGTKCLGYGLRSPDAKVRAEKVSVTRDGLSAEIIGLPKTVNVSSRLVGSHNLENILAAAAMARVLEVGPESVEQGINRLQCVPGRLERVSGDEEITVLVDYAHTPDALEHAVKACQEVTGKRLITVFGCGGDRDQGKRPVMGAVAVENSDAAIVTSDNPRTEGPLSIIRMIIAGIERTGATEISGEKAKELSGRARPWPAKKVYVVEPDRRKAIQLAVNMAGPGDVVLIAGKGHEDYQILGQEKIHFDDREEAREALEERQER